ncbi:hypothetical protein LRP31_17630 [Mesorhizobium mediterraneum]|uniref:hypothetical protein n=1 Tax=Mesorhizobium mediterraneum TaxID=43617 RepID=UPI001FD99B5A|nr:hypothetical protein [Mesorhizobium mediterraneum]WIW50924.1 hypothetical protein LRP31_17630 [Mesorhizobium mediterraneum]
MENKGGKMQRPKKASKDAVDASVAAVNERVASEVARRKRIVRSFPAAPFEEPLAFAKQIFDFGSGETVQKLTLFDHLSKSPESGASRQLIINAGRYGLIKGGVQADKLELTPDGVRSVDPTMPPREQARARIKLAIEDIEIFAKLYDRLLGKALPAKAALVDAAAELGATKESAEEAVDTFILNLRFVGLMLTLSGAERIVSKDIALDKLPPSLDLAPAAVQTSTSGSASLVTAEHAQFSTTCFYITPIGSPESEQRKHSDLFLGSFVEPALASFGMSVVRADGIDKPGVITKQIIEYIVKSRLVIVDLSYHNPNVFYELAIRHMMRLPIVQIVRKSDPIPFDINQMRTIVIDTTDIFTLIPKIASYQSEISSQVRRALENADEVETPISTYFPQLRANLV